MESEIAKNVLEYLICKGKLEDYKDSVARRYECRVKVERDKAIFEANDSISFMMLLVLAGSRYRAVGSEMIVEVERKSKSKSEVDRQFLAELREACRLEERKVKAKKRVKKLISKLLGRKVVVGIYERRMYLWVTKRDGDEEKLERVKEEIKKVLGREYDIII